MQKLITKLKDLYVSAVQSGNFDLSNDIIVGLNRFIEKITDETTGKMRE